MKLDSGKYNYQPPKFGLLFLQVLIASLFIILCARFWYLQILKGQEYAERAEANRTRTEKIFAPRGIIYDRNNKKLAENNIIFDLTIVREDCPDIAGTIAKVAIILGVDKDALQKRYDNARKRAGNFEPLPILKDISFEEVALIESYSLFLPGLQIQTQSRRFYPEGEAFAHVLGYVAEADEKEIKEYPALDMGDSIGKQGLELTVENRLRGIKGEYKNQRDAFGKILFKDLQTQSQPGESIVLSLDADLQHKIIDIMDDYIGTVIVMNPHNGHILSAVTLPSYDNNLFVSGLSHAEWNRIVNDERYPLHNRAVQSMYPPASIWKIMMADLILANNISPDQEVVCTGSVKIGANTFRCWHRGGHGRVNLAKALMVSCDSYFYLMGEELGISKIAAYAEACGFGATTGVDLPNEKAGFVPTAEWKREKLNEVWRAGDTVNVAIGQGQTLVTPLQVASYISSLLNGGKLLKPQIFLSAEAEINSTTPTSFASRELIKQIMVNTASYGTASVLTRKNKNILIGAKTGTAQVKKLQMQGGRVLRNDELDFKSRDHAWMVSFAQHKGKDVVIVVMLEHGGSGSSNAGPVVADIINYIYRNDI